MTFDWDDANTKHIERHGVDPEEAEDAVLDETVRSAEPKHHLEFERRFGAPPARTRRLRGRRLSNADKAVFARAHLPRRGAPGHPEVMRE